MIRIKTLFTLALLAVTLGAAPGFAQTYDPDIWGKNGNAALPDPSRTSTAPIYGSVVVDGPVVIAAPASGTGKAVHDTACSAMNPCAVIAPAARG